jgi:cholesterol transport system auxiliary component
VNALNAVSRRAVRVALALGASLLTVACASKLPRAPEAFTLDPPAPRTVPPPGATRVLSLRPAEVAPAYAGGNLVYRVGAHAIERDPYASFAAPPAWLLTSAIRGYLRDADYVRDVVVPGEGVPVDAEIEPALTEIAGDFTDASQPTAVMVVHFRVLVPGPTTAPGREILLKTYTGRRAISERTAAAVVAAWNEALAEIMAQFLADLKSALPPPRSRGVG